MLDDVHASGIVAFHDAALQTTRWTKVIPPHHHDGVWKYVVRNHRFNSLRWDEEDRARRRGAAPADA